MRVVRVSMLLMEMTLRPRTVVRSMLTSFYFFNSGMRERVDVVFSILLSAVYVYKEFLIAKIRLAASTRWFI